MRSRDDAASPHADRPQIGRPLPSFALVALALASSLSTVSALLMLRGALAARTSYGLATGLLVLNLFIHPFWMTYALRHHNLLQAGATLIWTTVVVCWWGYWLTDRGHSFRWAPVGVVAWVSSLLVASIWVPYPVFGWIGGAAGVASSVPQVVALYRASELGSGFNLRGWTALLVSGSAWLTYGIAAHEPPMIVTNSIALTLNAAMVLRAYSLPRAPRPVLVRERDLAAAPA